MDVRPEDLMEERPEERPDELMEEGPEERHLLPWAPQGAAVSGALRELRQFLPEPLVAQIAQACAPGPCLPAFHSGPRIPAHAIRPLPSGPCHPAPAFRPS